MRPHPILTMAIFYIIVQVGAIILAPLFIPQADLLPNPNDPINPLIYIVMILLMTAIMLILIRSGRQKILQIIFYIAIIFTLFYIFTPILLEIEIQFSTEYGGWPSIVGSAIIAFILLLALMKNGEWYVINAVGLILAIGVTAILGVIFGILPVIILLIIMAIYDAIAVYKTKHMVALAEGVAPMRLPMMFVVPSRRDFSMNDLKDKRLSSQDKRERDAFFMGLGDVIIPGILTVSASVHLTMVDSFILTSNLWVAIGVIIGGLIGYVILLNYVMKGNPQAGLPFLNSGAIFGYIIAYLIVYQNLSLGAIGL